MFRTLGKSKITFLLAILFGISLFFFRGQERYSNFFNSDNVVASVSGTPISTSKFLRVMQLNINQYNQLFGRSLTAEEIQNFQIHSMALGQLINNAVFENEFDNKKFIIDETVVASETKKRFPNLYNNNNKINEQALNSFLSEQNLKIDDLVKIIDYEARSNIFDKLFFDLNYPNELHQIIGKYNNHIRNISLIKLNIDDFKLESDNLDISISNKKIIDFFNTNQSDYIDPEKRDISYLLIDKKKYSNQFEPSDNQIIDYYNENKILFLEQEKRNFIQFNFKDLDEAKNFRLKINNLNNDQIIKYAKDNNIFFNEFKNVSKLEVLEELSNVIFSLDINQISEVVETTLAKHILIVNKISPETQRNLEQSREEIFNALLEVELNNYFLDLKNKISLQIQDGYSINEISKDNSIEIKTIKNTPLNNTIIGDDIINNKIISKAFQTNKDFVTDLIDIDEQRSVIINVDEIKYAKPYEIDAIFEEVSSDWLKSLKIASIEKKINEIMQSSKSIEDISIFVNSEVLVEDLQLNNDKYPVAVTNNIFVTEIDEIIISTINDEIYISKINNISFPSDQYNIQKISITSELKGSFGSEILKEKNISTNDNLIQALISQY
tara:strand:- start:28892 stop:30724 length:1833 start_codon:yes stop_codon:yes gene_type:complete